MATNGGLTFHVHGSEFSSPEYASQMSQKRAAGAALAEDSPLREVLNFIVQALCYILLLLIICGFGFITGLEFLTYPVLLRKITCSKGWSAVAQSTIPTSTLFPNMVGSVLGGIVIDKVGRRPVFIVASLAAIACELVNLTATDTLVYIISRGIASFCMGVLYLATLLYSIETTAAKHRLHFYLLHSLAQNTATTLTPLVLVNTDFTENTPRLWTAASSSVIVILGLGIIVGILYPEPVQSAKVREGARALFHSKFSVMKLQNEDQIGPEERFALYSDMFYRGGKVAGVLLVLLFYVGGVITTSILLTFPLVSDVAVACPDSLAPRPCSAGEGPTSLNEMLGVFGCSFIGSVLGYVSVQRYGRKNTYRGPAALRVIVVISMVLCGSHNLTLTQAGLVVLCTAAMDFTLDLYSVELFAIRSRATAFGLLTGLKLLGMATAFLINPIIMSEASPDLRFSVLTIVGTLMFGCSLGLRKDTFVMALNIGDATIDIGL